MNDQFKYGKSPFNPVNVNGIEASLIFLNSMITSDNKPFLYHRIHTTSVRNSKPIDCYEIYKGEMETDVLFFNTYSLINDLALPEGYKMTSNDAIPMVIKGHKIITTIGVNHKLRQFPDDLLKNL